MKYYSFGRKVQSRHEGQKEQREERGRRRFGMKLPGVGRGYCLTTDQNTLESWVCRSSFPLILTETSWDREEKEETPSAMNGAGDQNGERFWMRGSQGGIAEDCQMAYCLGWERVEGGKKPGKEKARTGKDSVSPVSNERNKGLHSRGREGKPRDSHVAHPRRSEGAFLRRVRSARCFFGRRVVQAASSLRWWLRMLVKISCSTLGNSNGESSTIAFGSTYMCTYFTTWIYVVIDRRTTDEGIRIFCHVLERYRLQTLQWLIRVHDHRS